MSSNVSGASIAIPAMSRTGLFAPSHPTRYRARTSNSAPPSLGRTRAVTPSASWVNDTSSVSRRTRARGRVDNASSSASSTASWGTIDRGAGWGRGRCRPPTARSGSRTSTPRPTPGAGPHGALGSRCPTRRTVPLSAGGKPEPWDEWSWRAAARRAGCPDLLADHAPPAPTPAQPETFHLSSRILGYPIDRAALLTILCYPVTQLPS